MALGIRAEFIGASVDDTEYHVKIYEEGYVGSVLTLTPSADMFQIQYKPKTDDIAGFLAPSVVNVEFYIMSASERTLISDILAFQQKDFYITIEQKISGASVFSPYWKGVILQDQIEEIDADRGLVSLAAIDGLSRLQDIDYDFSDLVVDGDFSYTTVQGIIYTALAQAMPLELWDGTTEPFLTTSVNWFTNDQSYTTIADPLFTQLFSVQAFTNIKDAFGISFFLYKTCFEVLEIFAKAYLSRVYMADGQYYFEQIPERRAANVKRNKYNKNNTGISNSLVPVTIAINQTREKARLAGNLFRRQPALKRVTIEQQAYNSQNSTQFNHVISSGSFPVSTSNDVGLYAASVSGTPVANVVPQLADIEVQFNYAALYTMPNSEAVVDSRRINEKIFQIDVNVDVEVKLDSASTANVYYFDGSLWQTSVTIMTIKGPSIRQSYPVVFTGNHNLNNNSNGGVLKVPITTAPFPETGRITITVKNDKVRRLTALPNTYVDILPIDYTLQGYGISVDFKIRYPNNNAIRFFSLDNDNTNIGDFKLEDLGVIEIGDGALQTGYVFVEDSSGDYQPTTSWNYANNTDDLSLAGLLIRERLAIQKEVLEYYSGSLFMVNGYSVALDFESTRWIAMQYSFIAGSGIVSGDYVAINRLSVSATADQNLGLTNNISAFTPFGKVDIAGVSIGNQEVGATLYLDEETVQRKLTFLSSGQKNNYTLIDASPAGSGSIDIDATVVKLSWAGADGSFTLEIPQASDMDGQRLEIILDGTFTSARNIEITPAAGNIQGSTSLEINNAYTRLILRAVDEEWY